jgi:predicted transcriptional regulator
MRTSKAAKGRRSAHVNFHMSEPDRAALDDLAQQEDQPVSALLRRAVRRELDRCRAERDAVGERLGRKEQKAP